MYFTMEPGKNGRLKYLALTILPAVLTTGVMNRLAASEIIPANDLTGFATMALSLVIMGGLGYFLILRKNHTIEVSDISIAEKDFQGKCRLVSLSKIRRWKKNVLGEILLLDGNDNVLLCVESNMERRDKLLAFLDSHEITEYKKEH